MIKYQFQSPIKPSSLGPRLKKTLERLRHTIPGYAVSPVMSFFVVLDGVEHLISFPNTEYARNLWDLWRGGDVIPDIGVVFREKGTGQRIAYFSWEDVLVPEEERLTPNGDFSVYAQCDTDAYAVINLMTALLKQG